MDRLIKFLPGFVAALVAFFALKIVLWLGVEGFGWQVLTFFGSYLALAYAVERAMGRYARTHEDGL